MADKLEVEMVRRPVFFVKAHGGDKGAVNIDRLYTVPDEIREWEQMMLEQVGLKIDGAAHIARGGCCCGGGGMCDVD